MSPNADLVALGRAIRQHRRAKAISQEDLAERTSLHRNYIGLIERGERNPTAKTLIGLARELGLTLAELVSELG